jgi:hypothetical protein
LCFLPRPLGLLMTSAHGGKPMESRGMRKLTVKEQQKTIDRIFELRLQLIALVERLLADGVDPNAIEAEILMREQISGRAH